MSKRDGSFVFSRWPLVLPHAQIRRMVVGASLLILSRQLTDDAYEVHDELAVRRNARHKRSGRSDLQTDPAMFVIEITDITERQLLDLDLLAVRQAGFKTLEEFYCEWLQRRRAIVVGLDVKLYTFRVAEDALYLHKRVHRGYTRNPNHAIPDEPQVVDREVLDRFAEDARDRYVAQHADELAKREARSLSNQLREAHSRAARRGVDVTPEIAAIRAQLDQIRNKLGEAA